MQITCPACRASYEIPDHLLVSTPERIRCARCGAEWAWARAMTAPAEKFDLPDLFSPGPVTHAPLEPAPDLSALTDPDQIKGPITEPILNPVFHPDPEPPLSYYQPLPDPPAAPPISFEPPPMRMESPVEIPQMPVVGTLPPVRPHLAPAAAPIIAPSIAQERAMMREDTFRRVIENTRHRSLAAPRPQSRRPQFIAILAVILLIALIVGAHFALVHGVITRLGS